MSKEAEKRRIPITNLKAAAERSSESRSNKPKLEIETFEQFIEYAYRRRGQSLNLPPKTQKVIATRTSLDEAAKDRLLKLANADATLAVPRQILLVSKEVSRSPQLRGAMTNFVADVLQYHQAFAHDSVQAAVRNLPDAASPAEALAIVARYKPPGAVGTGSSKPTELKQLRCNATNLLATWFALNRNISFADLADVIFHALWGPAAQELIDDSERLRVLTGIEDAAGVGMVAQGYRQRAAVEQREREQAFREVAVLRQQVANLIVQRDEAQARLDENVVKLDALRESTAHEISTLREAHNVGRLQQGHEFESLRGRLVRRLEESVEMLDTGLSALRKETPRVSVMVERAEVVIDALRSELNSLKEV